MTPREAIIAKIQKLAAMTTSAGATENEAAMAAAAIDRLMREYNVTMDETTVRQEAAGCVDRKWTEILRDGETQTIRGIASAIAKLTGTRCWFETTREDLFETGDFTTMCVTHFFGLPADAAGAVAMAEIISGAITNEYASWRKDTKRRHGANVWESFRQGIAARLIQRLGDLANVPQQKGLVVLKDGLVNDQFNALGLRLGRGVTKKVHDSRAYQGGMARGDRVDLGHGRKVGGYAPRKLAHG